jgi:hypothetical protein
MNAKIKGGIIIIVLLGVIYGTFKVGEHRGKKKITYFSELVEKTRGGKGYLIDMEVICTNGKDIGRLQLDVNLTNGQIVVARNDSQLEPNCTR